MKSSTKIKVLLGLILAFVLALGLCVFAACGGNDDTPSGDTPSGETPEGETPGTEASIEYQFEANCTGHNSWILLDCFSDNTVECYVYSSYGTFTYTGTWSESEDSDGIKTLTVRYYKAIANGVEYDYTKTFEADENLDGDYEFDVLYGPLYIMAEMNGQVMSYISDGCDGKGTLTDKIYTDPDEWYSEVSGLGSTVVTLDDTADSCSLIFYSSGIVQFSTGGMGFDFNWTYSADDGLSITAIEGSGVDGTVEITGEMSSISISFTISMYGQSMTGSFSGDVSALAS